MDQNWDIEKIKELFRESKQKDERLTPSFDEMWRTAVSGVRPTRRSPLLRLASATIGLALIAGSAVFFLNEFSKRPTASASVMLISQWRSPTDALLIPQGGTGEELLKNIPQLEKSLIEINITAPENN